MAKKEGAGFSQLLAYCIVGGAGLGIIAAMFFVRGYSIDTGLVVGAVGGAAFAAAYGSMKGQV